MHRTDAEDARGLRDDPSSPAAIEAAFDAAAVRSYPDIKAISALSDRNSTAGLLLSSTVSLCEGDVLRAEATLRRAVERASDAERPYVVDVLAPLLMWRGLFARAAALLGTATMPERLEICRLALRSIVDAAAGKAKLSHEHARAAREAVVRLDDDILTLRVHQRLALAAYYRHDAAEALDEVAHGLRSARMLGAHRAASTLHSVGYAAHYGITGDVDAAWREASAMEREAGVAGDRTFRASARVALYELAAERGDEPGLLAARAALDAEPLPEQYRDRFSCGVADVLGTAWRGEFAACRNLLGALNDTPGRTDSERALCRSLSALVAIALGDDDAARRFGRQAIASSARPHRHLPAYALRYRRLARVLAVVAGELAGEVMREQRATTARCVRDDADLGVLLESGSGASCEPMPMSVRGYVRVIHLVRERLAQRPCAGPLTDAEVEILRLAAAGRNAPQIAAVLSRSPHTVRTHLRNAGAKLETRTRADMLARARQLGILTDPC